MVSIATDRRPESEPEAAHAGSPPAIPNFDIVPRLGLVFAGVIFVALVVTVATNTLWPLVFMHVAFGAAWTITDLFVGLILGPILGKLSVPARVEFTIKFMPKMVVLMPALVTATLVAGWQLSTKLGTNQIGNPGHGWVLASMIVVGIMAIVALGLLEPANIGVLTELKKPRPNPQVIERLMKRFVYSAGVTGVMQVATLVIMTKLATV
jgi:hypothetical protein